jgi:hypothetical protein
MTAETGKEYLTREKKYILYCCFRDNVRDLPVYHQIFPAGFIRT